MVGALFGLAIPAVISSLLGRPDSYISLMGEPFWFASGLNFSYVALPRWLLLLSVQMKYDDIGGPHMSTITYKVVKHDGGWAYEANGTYSERRSL